MSDETTTVNEISFAEQKGLTEIKLEEAKKIIKVNYLNHFKLYKKGVRKPLQAYKLIGEAGIGKTAICPQLAKELETEINKLYDMSAEFKFIKINCATLEKGDFVNPFPVESKKDINGDNFIYKMLLSEFVPTEKGSFGVFLIDEFSRGSEDLQQAMMQVLNERMIHTYKFPDNWLIIATDNPDTVDYSMNWTSDAALLRRSATWSIREDIASFTNYAKSQKFHPFVVNFVNNKQRYFYDHTSKKAGKIYANPASWERISDILWGYGEEDSKSNIKEIKKNLDIIEIEVAGWINDNVATIFKNYIEGLRVINPEDIFFSYKKVRKEVKKYVETKDTRSISELVTSFTNYLISYKPDIEKDRGKKIRNCVDFLLDIPLDTGIVFAIELKSLRDQNGETTAEYKYLEDLIRDMLDHKDFDNQYFEAINKIYNEE